MYRQYFQLHVHVYMYRLYFDEAKEAYKTHGDDSELFVIIIDEIDAICKPRGMTLTCI